MITAIYSGVLLLIFTAATKKFRNPFNPVFLIVAWWSVWSAVATLAPTGMIAPAFRVHLAVWLMLCSFAVGSLMAKPGGTRITSHAKSRRLNDALKHILPIQYALCAFLICILITRRTAYLGDVLDGTGRGSILAEKSAVMGARFHMLWEYFAKPTVLIVAFYGIGRVRKNQAATALILGLGLTILWSFVLFNRAQLYLALLVFAACFLEFLFARAARGKKAKFAWVLLMVTVTGMAANYALSVLRVEKRSLDAEQLVRTTVDYHTGGLTMLSFELESPVSLANSRLTLGRSTLGGLDELLLVSVGRYSGITPQVTENFDYRQDYAVVGTSPDGSPIRLNAFFTVLHSFYLDGRWVGIVFFPFIFGLAVGSTYLKAVQHGSEFHYLLTLIFLYVGFMSLFTSPPEEANLWLCVGEVLVLGNFELFRAKRRSADMQ